MAQPQHHVAPPKQNPLAGLIALIGMGVMIWYLFGGGIERQAASNLADIKDQVAQDAVHQYEIAHRSGSAMDACVQAGIVAAAYLQSANEAEYQKWKAVEAADCRRAGVPR